MRANTVARTKKQERQSLTPQRVEPEWLRLQDVFPIFGLRRPWLYALEKKGVLRFKRLAFAGSQRPVVVVRTADVRALIESAPDSQPATSTK